MTTPTSLEQLIRDADTMVQQTLRYLEGPGAKSSTRIGRWGIWEVAAHLLYWHRTTAQAAQGVAQGEPPKRFTSPVDDINEEAVAHCAGMGLADIVDELREAHQDLLQAIRDLPDPDVPLMRRFDGTAPTAKDRLRTIAHHWSGHLKEMQGAKG